MVCARSETTCPGGLDAWSVRAHTRARTLTHTWIRKWTFPAGGELFLELYNDCFQLLDLLLRSVSTIAGTRSENHKQKVQQRRATGKHEKCCHLQSCEKEFRASTRGRMQEDDVRAPRSPQSLQRHCLLHNPSRNKQQTRTKPHSQPHPQHTRTQTHHENTTTTTNTRSHTKNKK